MTLPVHALLIAGVATLALHGILLGGLTLAPGPGAGAARALVGFVPDCITLFRRLLADDRIPRRRGQLDDAVVVALVVCAICRGGTPGMLEEHWPGPRASLALIVRLAHGPAAA